jgi:O-antigen/teichoic acid export membrane protein
VSSPARSEIRHAVVLAGGTATAAVLALVYQFVVGHTLGTEEFADFATALSLVYFGAMAAGPISATATRFSAEFAERGEFGKIRSVAALLSRWVTGWGLVGCVIALVAVRPVSTWLHFRSVVPLVVAIAVVYLTLLVSLARGFLRGVQDFPRYNLGLIVEAGLRLGLGVLFVNLLLNAGAALAAYAIALVIVLPLSAGQVKSTWRAHLSAPVDPSTIRRFGLPMLLFALISAGFLTVDMVLVKRLFAAPEAGLYGGAVTLARSVGLIYAPFGLMLLPLFVAETVRGGRPLLTLLRVGAYFVGLAWLPVLAFMIWSTEILGLTFGSDFLAAAPLLVPLALCAMLAGISTLIGNALAGLDRFWFLVPYICGLVLETALLATWHQSLERVALMVLTAQALTALAMILTAIATPGLRGGAAVTSTNERSESARDPRSATGTSR